MPFQQVRLPYVPTSLLLHPCAYMAISTFIRALLLCTSTRTYMCFMPASTSSFPNPPSFLLSRALLLARQVPLPRTGHLAVVIAPLAATRTRTRTR